MSSRVSAALYEIEDEDTLRELVSSMSPDELHQFVEGYNWDDGCAAMFWVVERPDCDLGTALTVFWLAAPEFENGELLPAQRSFDVCAHELSAYIFQRIAVDGYARREIKVSVVPMLIANRMQLELLRRQGVPERLLATTPGTPPSIESKSR